MTAQAYYGLSNSTDWALALPRLQLIQTSADYSSSPLLLGAQPFYRARFVLFFPFCKKERVGGLETERRK